LIGSVVVAFKLFFSTTYSTCLSQASFSALAIFYSGDFTKRSYAFFLLIFACLFIILR